MTKAGDGNSVRSAIDLKARITSTLAKYSKLSIIFKKSLAQEEPDIHIDQDLTHKPTTTILRTEPEWKFGEDMPASDLELDPTTPQAQLAVLKKKLSK